MSDPTSAEAAAIRLAELSRDIEELESGRAALLNRVETLRLTLVTTGQRTATIRASVELMCEHITNMVMAAAELRALEDEVRDAERGVGIMVKETAGLLFESDSLHETLDEAEDDLEHLSSMLIGGKAKRTRGH